MDYFKFLNKFNQKYPNEIMLVTFINLLATYNIFLFNENIKKQFITTLFIIIFYFSFSSYSFEKKISIFITYYSFASTLLLGENMIIQFTTKINLISQRRKKRRLKKNPLV